jgi:hypothetical protein
MPKSESDELLLTLTMKRQSILLNIYEHVCKTVARIGLIKKRKKNEVFGNRI